LRAVHLVAAATSSEILTMAAPLFEISAALLEMSAVLLLMAAPLFEMSAYSKWINNLNYILYIGIRLFSKLG
jgi:hypothetical protein